jgi:Fe-Mn family superoxide dismutase
MNAILGNMSKYSTAIRNNAGGHYNHTLFWNVLTPNKNTKLSPELAATIETTFGSMEAFKTQLTQAAATRFGSGWAWLVVTPENKLVICSTPNQDNPLMDDAPVKGTPIFGIDVWEHAYYLKYQNKRGDYLQAIWNVVNWNEVSRLYAQTQVK